MRMMPRIVDPAAFKHIEAETDAAHEAAVKAGGSRWDEYSQDLVAQAEFLSVFEKNFSIGLSLKSTGVSMGAYSRWRRSSITFVQRLNEIIELWHEDIYTSAAVRARGRPIEMEDGSVHYIDADSQLTKLFLRAMHSEFDEKVDINMKGGLNNTSTPLDEDKYMALRDEMLKSDDC